MQYILLANTEMFTDFKKTNFLGYFFKDHKNVLKVSKDFSFSIEATYQIIQMKCKNI